MSILITLIIIAVLTNFFTNKYEQDRDKLKYELYREREKNKREVAALEERLETFKRIAKHKQ